MVPAAVVSMGMSFLRLLAAMITALYPAIVLMEESASIICALEILGTASMEKALTFLAASARAISRFAMGWRNAASTAPSFIMSISCFLTRSFITGFWTLSTASD